MSAVVIDTNCIVYFQNERVRGCEELYSELLRVVLAKAHIALDEGGKVEQEYYDTCKPSALGLNLQDWLADQIIKGRARYYRECKSLRNDCRKLGLPNKDQKWVGVAVGASSELIVTEDIDLFEPKAKSYKAAKKEKIKKSASGCIAGFLNKRGIKVRCGVQAIIVLEEW